MRKKREMMASARSYTGLSKLTRVAKFVMDGHSARKAISAGMHIQMESDTLVMLRRDSVAQCFTVLSGH
jgi:hypothetical protein